MVTPEPRVDLLLGPPLGLWALETGQAVGSVWTDDAAIAAAARARGLPVASGPEIASATASRALAVHWPHFLSGQYLARWEAVYALRPSLLPFGRGWSPVAWALWDGEPAGATLFRINGRLDAGPIIDQVAVPTEPDDDVAALTGRLVDAERALLTRWWPAIARGDVIPEREQDPGGSYHGPRETEERHAVAGRGWLARRLSRT